MNAENHHIASRQCGICAILNPVSRLSHLQALEAESIQIIREVRKAGRKFPILILTARRAPDDIKEAIRLGATDYLTKPFNDEQLLARIARLLRDGSLVHHDRVHHVVTRAVAITTDAPMPINLDGEISGTTPLTFTVERNAVHVVVPQHSRAARLDG